MNRILMRDYSGLKYLHESTVNGMNKTKEGILSGKGDESMRAILDSYIEYEELLSAFIARLNPDDFTYTSETMEYINIGLTLVHFLQQHKSETSDNTVLEELIGDICDVNNTRSLMGSVIDRVSNDLLGEVLDMLFHTRDEFTTFNY